MSLFDELDLGAEDYSQEKPSSLGQFTSKPSPRPYQPFGGPIQQAPQTYAAPQYYEQPQTPAPQSYNVFSDDELDSYERAKKDYSYINQYSSAASQIASKRKSAYDDFKKNKLTPFFEQIGGFAEFDDDDELAAAIDEMEASTLKTSQMDDGWFGPSDEKIAAGESLKNFKLWSSPNGLRDQYRRLRAERDQYQGIADTYKSEKLKRLEGLTSIPVPARQALDDALSSRKKGPPSSKQVNAMLDSMPFEQASYSGAGLANPDKIDPRSSILFDDIHGSAKKRQSERMSMAKKGNFEGLLSRRQYIARERQLRDKGFFFSESGLLDGRPIGLSRRDVDLLDIDDMRKAGMTSYQGRPLDEAMAELGGEERLEMAKVMESVYSAKSNYEDAQLAFLKVAGGGKAEKARQKMEAAREDMQKTIGLAASYGLDNELFEQAETTSWLGGLGNAIKRGMLMSEMSSYTDDFLTNTLDADEMQRFIEIASEIEKLPTSSTMKRVKETKSDGFLDAIGNLLFDNPAAIPEMFVESLSSFLPTTIKWLLPSAAAGAAVGTAVAPGAGTLAGASIGARTSWGVASFVLEASGMALEGMQELNIDWKNPKVFAAAWTNESIRNKIQKKMIQKGLPIAVADTLTGMMAGRVMGVVNHTGDAMFRGGKLLNKEAFDKAAGSVPRFTLMQKTKNAAAELGADSFMGMSGEYLGQWASKEPGEDWDWDAIAAEGLIGIGPGAVGAALEMRGPRANYFGNAPIEILGEQQTGTGTAGTVNRAGYTASYQTFNDADSMMAHFEDIVPQGTTQEEQDRRAASLAFTRRWVNLMFKIRPEAMAGLKIAISPRTPDANLKNRGTFESRDGHNIIYLNEKEFAFDPMGTMFHESGHFARIMLLTDEELMAAWEGLKPGEQLDAYTQYYTKEYDKSFDQHDEKTQKKIRRAFNKTDNEVLAEEWFSYQWARVLNANYKPDKSVKGIEKFYTGLVRPLFAEYTGTESVAGNKKGDELIIDEQIRRFLEDGFVPSAQQEIDKAQEVLDTLRAEYEEGFTTQKAAGANTRAQGNVFKALEQKLKAMMLPPKQARKIARTLNAMVGDHILSTDISFYTRMERGSLKAAGADLQDREEALAEEGKLVKSVDGGVQAFVSDLVKSDKPETGKVEVSSKADKKQESSIKGKLKKPAEIKEDNLKGQISRVKELIKKADAPKKKEALSKRLAGLESDLKSFQNRDKDRVYTPATLKNKPQPQVLQKSDSVRESNLKKQIAKTEERLRQAEGKPESDKLEDRLDGLKRKLEAEAKQKEIEANKSRLTMTGKEVPVKETKRNFDKLQKQGEAPTQDIPKETEQFYDDKLLFEKRASEMMALDRLIPTNITLKGLGWVKDISKSVRVDLNKAANSTRDKFKSIEALDKAIDQAIDKLGPEASSGQIIAEVLNLEKLLELAPRSFKSEFERRVNDNIKNNRSREIEDLAAEAHEKIEDYKGQLRTRIADIDKQIDSLGKNDPQEVRNLKQKKGLARKFLDLIAPEEMAIDWKDLPVANLFYLDGKDPKPFTLGMLANKRSKYSGESKIYRKTKTGFKQWKGESRSGQELLWDFVTKFDVTKAPRELGALGTFPDGKVLSPKEYEMALEAVKASAMFNQKRKIGSEAKGKARYEKVEGENVEASKGYPSGYQSEKGGSLAAIVAERLRKNKKLRVGREPLSLNPTVEEILALKAANGRSLELLGDPSDTERDFNLLVAGILRDGDVKDGEGEYAEIEDYARVAREQIASGTPVVEALRNIPSILQRKKFEEDAREADSESAMSENADIKPRGNKIFITKGFNVPAEKDYNAVKVMDAKRGSETVEETQEHGAFTRSKIFETFDALSSYSEGRTKKEIDNFKKNRTNIQKTEEMPDRPISGSREDSDLQSTTDISAADFANWYLSEGPDAKSGKADDARKGGLTRAQKRLRDLQALPSSKDNKQLPGGLGEGLLPYVFVDFARAMYAKLGLKNAKAIYEKAQAASRNSNFKWNYERGTMLVDGKPSDEFKPFVKEAERMTPEGMDILAKPIVQAVIDAEGVDIYNQIDPNEETMLQRDTQMGNTKKEDDSAEMGDDSGEAEDVFETESDAVANEQRKKDLIDALQTKPDALKDRRKVSDELLEEVYYSGTASSIVEAAKEELDRRGVKGVRTLNSDAGRAKKGVSYDQVRNQLMGSGVRITDELPEKIGSSQTFWKVPDSEVYLVEKDEVIDEMTGERDPSVTSVINEYAQTQLPQAAKLRNLANQKFKKIYEEQAPEIDKEARQFFKTEFTKFLPHPLDIQEMMVGALWEAAEEVGFLRYNSTSNWPIKGHKGPHPSFLDWDRQDAYDATLLKIPKTLNSDAKILTSDADPNLSKLGILARIASGNSDERAEEFKKWMDSKKDSIKTGSFKMNFVDRADPLKQFHRGLVKVLKKVGIDENHPLYEQLNVHGRLHQYFGSGYETVEQAELNFINPIKDLLREHNIDLKTFGEYLLARAAPSRNRQIKARADELLADIKREEKDGEGSAKYEAERAKYYDKDGKFILNSGIDEATAIEVVKKLEADPNFKKFAEKALPIYYRMNLSALDKLVDSGMIQQIDEKTEQAGVTGFREKTAMIKAASRFPWAKHSSIKMPDDVGNYTYAPMQGFEGETQNYLDGEAAWEEFGAAGTGGSGKGFDQPKGRGILKGAFGRSGAVGPDPNAVFAVSVNQYFNNNILAAKNEVAQAFGSMFEAIRELTHPQKDPATNPEFQGRFLSEDAESLLKDLSKLDEGMVQELKDEFDKIFEPDYKMVEGKKLYEYPDGSDKLVMSEKQLSTVYKNDPLTFVYRQGGQAYLIKFKSTPEGLRMADTMKNLRYESLPSILQFFNKGTRFMARMFTSMNPAFIIPNFFRDLGTAAIHLTEDGKKKMFKDAVNMKNIGSFAKAIFKTEQMIANGDNPNKNPEIKKLLALPVKELANSTHPMAGIARYQKAKQNGAKIGYFRHESVPELIRGIQKDLKKNKKGLSKKGLAKLGSFVDSSNTAIENSIRMSSFWAAIKNGYTEDQAAVIARNVTVDFNQKGNLTQALGSLYVFFGASMNSMHRFVTSWNRRSTEDKIKMFGGIAAASMTIALFNRLVDDDEDEEMPDYDTISSYKRDTNFILPLPAGLPEFFNDEKDTGYFSIPLPLGYNLFWTVGQVAADMFAKTVLGRGGEGLIGGSTRIMDSAMNAFNPIGGATIATIGTPSLVTPLVELYANKNFMGSPIRYEDQPFEVPKPAYMQDPKSTPKHWNDLSKAINSFMGGSETVKGSVKGMLGGNPLMYSSDEDIQFDLSGNQMRHAILGYLGGPGQIADSMLGAMITGVQGESSIRNINDIPMINRFVRATTYGSKTRDTFYGLRDAIKTAEKAVKTAKEISPQAYASVLKDNKSLLQLSSQISALDKQKNKLRRLRNKIEGSKALSEEQKTQRVDEIQKKELNLMVAVIKKAQSLGIS